MLDSYFSAAQPIIPSSSNGGALISADSNKASNLDSASQRYLKMIEQAKRNVKPVSVTKKVAKPNERELQLLSSSKSIQILDPKKMPFKIDSLLLDSIFYKKY